jgi:hypothetical protein
MCGHGEYYGHHGHGGCCCQPGGFHGHHFHQYSPSREERIARMEEYLKNLQAEVQNLQESIAEIKAAK